jgi:hypothetical protein
MQAIRGYYNGKEIISLEKVSLKPNQKIIITVLDEYLDVNPIQPKPYKKFVGKLNTQSFQEISSALKETEKVDYNEW